MDKIDSKLKFYTTNILDVDFDNWTLVDTTVAAGLATIEPGGYMEYTVTDNDLIKASLYAKLTIDLEADLTIESNYTPVPAILLTEDYITDDINKRRTRKLGVPQFKANNPSTDRYDTEQLIPMLNQDLDNIVIKIYNTKDTDIVIHTVAIYRSVDVRAEQIYSSTSIPSTDTFGSYIEARLDDPVSPSVGRIWLRVDL